MELIVTAWQYWKKKTMKVTEVNIVLENKKQLDELANKLAEENKISTDEIFFIYKTKDEK